MTLFCLGLLGAGLETFYSLHKGKQPDPSLVVLFGAMMGLPVYLSQDAKRNEDDQDDSDGPGGHRGRRSSERPTSPSPRTGHDDSD